MIMTVGHPLPAVVERGRKCGDVQPQAIMVMIALFFKFFKKIYCTRGALPLLTRDTV
jgi:hypothetical protein